MPEQPDIDLDAHRLDLLKAKLGKLFDWRRPEIVDTVGPFDPSVFERYDNRRLEIVETCSARLRAFSADEIRALGGPVDDEKDDDDEDHGLRADWRTFLVKDINRLLNNEPPWFSGGFGHPSHVPDFEYWCTMPSFTIEELLCLSIGISPKDFDAKRVNGLRHKSRKQELWPSLQYLVDRHEQIARAFPRSQSGRKIFSAEFLKWSAKVELDTHPEFTNLLKRYNDVPSGDRKTAGDLGKADEREIDSLAKLLTAIAIREYGYQPGAPRSPIPKEIAEICAELGLSVSNETVLKYLRRGAKFLPDNWKPE